MSRASLKAFADANFDVNGVGGITGLELNAFANAVADEALIKGEVGDLPPEFAGAFPMQNFTPTVTAGTTAPTGVTYSSSTIGGYIQMGLLVFFSSFVRLTSIGSGGAGEVRISLPGNVMSGTLPFTSVSRIFNVALSAGYTQCVSEPLVGTAYARLIETGNNVAAQAINWAALQNTSRVSVAGFYFA